MIEKERLVCLVQAVELAEALLTYVLFGVAHTRPVGVLSGVHARIIICASHLLSIGAKQGLNRDSTYFYLMAEKSISIFRPLAGSSNHRSDHASSGTTIL